MIKLKFNFLALICVFQLLPNQQKNINAQDSPLNRFNHKEYNSFQEYLAMNIKFPLEERNAIGVLLPGIVLDDNGNIRQVFTLNSLSPSIDKSVMKLFGATNGFWKPKKVSGNNEKAEIIIVPVIFSFAGAEYKLDTSNFKLSLQDELIISASIIGRPDISIDYTKTKRLIRRYKKSMFKEKYTEASEYLTKLIKREPLNVEYYSKLIALYSLMDNVENACYYLKFVKTYFKNQPDIKMSGEIDCEKF